MDENVLTDFLGELIEGFGVIVRYEAIKQDEDSVKVVGGFVLTTRGIRSNIQFQCHGEGKDQYVGNGFEAFRSRSGLYATSCQGVLGKDPQAIVEHVLPWRISLPDLLALQDVLDEVVNIFACPSFLIYSLDFLD